MTTSVENQNKFWMPTTPYTQTLNYGQRVLINDIGREIPLAWRVSKVEDVQPRGITKLTFAQQLAVLQEDCGKYGIANWCTVADRVLPKPEACMSCPLKEPEYIDAGIEMPKPELPRGKIIYNGKDATLRVGGSAKTFTAMFWDEENQKYINYKPMWKLSLKDGDNLLCSIVLDFDANQNDDNKVYLSWHVNLASDCPPGVTLGKKFDNSSATVGSQDGCTIICTNSNGDIFNVHVEPSKDDIYVLVLRCGQLYNMVCKSLIISAQNDQGQFATETKMEVVS